MNISGRHPRETPKEMARLIDSRRPESYDERSDKILYGRRSVKEYPPNSGSNQSDGSVCFDVNLPALL